jgi:hypothetical protein
MKKGPVLAAGIALALLFASCSGDKPEYYLLQGGDPAVDWFEFASDSTILWVGPGGVSEQSRYEENEAGEIVVYTAPFSVGRMHRVDGKTIEGEPPFFEGTWKRTNHRR